MARPLDTMDELDPWKNTMPIFMTDHGTFNGDHGRVGKGQTREFSGKSHTSFIVYHPHFGHGERRSQLGQNVDVYCTVLAALDRLVAGGAKRVLWPFLHGLLRLAWSR